MCLHLQGLSVSTITKLGMERSKYKNNQEEKTNNIFGSGNLEWSSNFETPFPFTFTKQSDLVINGSYLMLHKSSPIECFPIACL